MQGGAGALGFEGPPEEFDGGLGEAVAFEGSEAGIKVGGGVELAADDEGAEDVADEVVDGAGGFGDVVGARKGVASDQAVTSPEVALTRTESMAWSSP